MDEKTETLDYIHLSLSPFLFLPGSWSVSGTGIGSWTGMGWDGSKECGDSDRAWREHTFSSSSSSHTHLWRPSDNEQPTLELLH